MENIQYLSLDIMNNHVYEYAYAKQYDEGRTLIFTVTENDKPYNLNGVLATFQMKKPDNTVILDSCTIDDNKIKINVTRQMTAIQGKVPYQIQLLQGETIISTVTGFLKVSKSVVDPDDVISSNEFNALNDALIKVNKDYTYVMESAQASADNAKVSEINAKESETNAINSASLASESEQNAKKSEANAANSASTATSKANDASTSATNASASATNAETYAKQSQSYAVGTGNVRPNEKTDSAKYYYEQAKSISESFAGALRPMGTVTFTNLPTLSSATEGDMYNVSDQFTTTSDFKEGAGNIIPAGSNVYKTTDNKWDVLAGTPVTGIKGNAENTYRRGNVNITPANIGAVSTTGDASNTTNTFITASSRTNLTTGEKISISLGKIAKWFSDLKTVAFSGSYNDLSNKPTIPAAVAVKGNKESSYRTGDVNLTPANLGALATDGDSSNTSVLFTNYDSTNAGDNWQDIGRLYSSEKLSDIIKKISCTISNVRYLYKILGTTDISAIGNGTVTNAISTLNSNLVWKHITDGSGNVYNGDLSIYKDIYIGVVAKGTKYIYTFYLPGNSLNSTTYTVINGYSIDNYKGVCELQISNSQIKCSKCVVSNTSYTGVLFIHAR